MTTDLLKLPAARFTAKLSKDGQWASLEAPDWTDQMWAYGTEQVYDEAQMREYARANIEAARPSLSAQAVGDISWPARYACDGPEGFFWTDSAILANKLISPTFDRDDWTITDVTNPTGANQGDIYHAMHRSLACTKCGRHRDHLPNAQPADGGDRVGLASVQACVQHGNSFLTISVGDHREVIMVPVAIANSVKRAIDSALAKFQPAGGENDGR